MKHPLILCLALAACNMQEQPRKVDHKRIDFAVHRYCTLCDTPNVAVHIKPERHYLYLKVERGLLMPCAVSEDVYVATREGATFKPENCNE